MGSMLSALLVAVLLLNLFALGTSRIRALINAAGLQGIALGLMPLLVHSEVTLLGITVSTATIILKGALIPRILLKALRDAQIKREIEPIIGLMPSMMLGAAATAASIVLATKLPPLRAGMPHLIVPASFSTVFTGFLLLAARVKAITQVVGYLLLENGIFIFGLLLLDAMPFLVELGVLLDVFVGVFVISIIIHHINREFASLDTRRLAALQE